MCAVIAILSYDVLTCVCPKLHLIIFFFIEWQRSKLKHDYALKISHAFGIIN
jgi:hypothetical protein